jgi:hypothetical protein
MIRQAQRQLGSRYSELIALYLACKFEESE